MSELADLTSLNEGKYLTVRTTNDHHNISSALHLIDKFIYLLDAMIYKYRYQQQKSIKNEQIHLDVCLVQQ